MATESESADIDREFANFRRMGANVQLLTREEVVSAMGVRSGFTCGISFPSDAIIDSEAYVSHVPCLYSVSFDKDV